TLVLCVQGVARLLDRLLPKDPTAPAAAAPPPEASPSHSLSREAAAVVAPPSHPGEAAAAAAVRHAGRHRRRKDKRRARDLAAGIGVDAISDRHRRGRRGGDSAWYVAALIAALI